MGLWIPTSALSLTQSDGKEQKKRTYGGLGYWGQGGDAAGVVGLLLPLPAEEALT